MRARDDEFGIAEVVGERHALSAPPSDEILISEGDMVGKTADQLRALHFARDCEHLQRND